MDDSEAWEGHTAHFCTRLGGIHRGDGPIYAHETTDAELKELTALKTWPEVLKWMRTRYDKEREKTRVRASCKSGKRLNERSCVGGHFVAIDSEGFNEATIRHEGGSIDYPHRTHLWMTGGAEEFENTVLEIAQGCRSLEIIDYLLSRPARLATHNGPAKDAKRPIFISFCFSYDVGQLVKDLPYNKIWELQNCKPFKERDNPDYPSNRNMPILIGSKYAIRVIPTKSVILYLLRNGEKPFKKGHKLDYKEEIIIYDCFGFFQMSLVAAIENSPGVVTPDELEIIKAGKKERGKFKVENVEEHKRYTALELKALVNLMNVQRDALRAAIPDKPIELKRWHGAGSIATVLLDMYLSNGLRGEARVKHIREILGSDEIVLPPSQQTSEQAERLDWVLRAYFGGRIDLVKQGNHLGKMHEYDVSSAYPAQAAPLPSMQGGRWEKVITPTREQVENASAVSMFHIQTRRYAHDLPFYVFPYRAKGDRIYYPPEVNGMYMRDHVIAGFEHYDYFE